MRKKNLNPDPIAQFAQWFGKAWRRSGLRHPEAMCLSTVDSQGFPEGRVVLLKDFDESGFVFYTNFQSTKGHSLKKTPRAALTFFWERLNRQVRIQGEVSKVSPEEADSYFQSRPRTSRLAAWASRQSQILGNRKKLEQRFQFFKKKFEGKKIPRPPFWGGYRVIPEAMEFWQGRPLRLHDRFLYLRTTRGWKIRRLYP